MPKRITPKQKSEFGWSAIGFIEVMGLMEQYETWADSQLKKYNKNYYRKSVEKKGKISSRKVGRPKKEGTLSGKDYHKNYYLTVTKPKRKASINSK